MRICNTVRVYPSHGRFGGMPMKAKIFSESLVKLGHEVTVLTTGLQKSTGSFHENLNGVDVYYLDCTSMEYSDQWWKNSNVMFQKLHEDNSFDVLHSESYSGYKIKTTCPKIATLHGSGYGLIETYIMMQHFGILDVPLIKAQVMYEDEVVKYKIFDRLIGVSNKETRILKQKYFHPNVDRIYNPVNQIFFSKNWSGSGDYYFSYGMCYTEKGIEQLKNLADKLKICYAGDKNPGGNVIYLGSLTQEQILDHLVSCKGFINLTLFTKGFDLTTCEAMAVGVPCFVSSIQVDEDLEDNKNCIFVNPYDFNCYKRIISVSEDIEKCKELSREAKFFAIENFDYKKMIQRFLTTSLS